MKLGWSGEVERNRWRKMDVTLGEVDLERLLLEFTVPTSHQPDTTQAFRLLTYEAERLLTAKLVDAFGMSPADGKHRMARLTEQIEAVADEIAGRARGLPQ